MRSRIIFAALLSCTVLFFAVSCEPLDPQTKRLAGEWRFKLDSNKVGLRQGWSDKGLDRSDWSLETVPGNWSATDYDGYAWYATMIKAENIPAGYQLALVFESIDDNAVIWLDGRLFGKQMGYGIKFWLDIGDELADGAEHELVLRIEDTGGPGGINGEVTLQPYIHEADLMRSEASKHQAPAAPRWAENMLVYEVFVRQHTPQGTLNALSADLDRLKDLGVDLIWLMPIHPAGQVKAKGFPGSPYAVQDYYAVSPDIGTLEDFKNLVKEVHDRDMHIILDFVLNHSAWDNELIESHTDWYSHNDSGQIISPNSDWYDVADFDYDQQGLRDYMYEMLSWWITETNIDGYRFDVAELVPNDFWVIAKQRCQAVKQDVFFLAEGAEPHLHLNGHDMTYSWNIWDGITQVAQGIADPSEVKRSYEMEAYQYPQGALRMRFTENHDKPRSATYIDDPDLNLTAWAFISMMKGNPLIYAGQEVGARVKPDLFTKDPVDWEAGDTTIATSMKALIKIRKKFVTPESAFQIIIANNDKRIMAYRHGPLLGFFNFSDEPFQFSAAGMEEILYGGITLNADSSLTLLAKNFGVIK